jgi:hypothetical protein
VSLKAVKEVVEPPGYVPDVDRIYRSEKGSYVWYEREDYKSWVGVELSIFKERGIEPDPENRARS